MEKITHELSVISDQITHGLTLLAKNQKIIHEELMKNRAILSDIQMRQDIGRNLRPILGRGGEEEEPVSRASNSTDLPSGVDYGSSVGTVYLSTVTDSSSIGDTLTDIPSIEEESDRRSQTRGRRKTM